MPASRVADPIETPAAWRRHAAWIAAWAAWALIVLLVYFRQAAWLAIDPASWDLPALGSLAHWPLGHGREAAARALRAVVAAGLVSIPAAAAGAWLVARIRPRGITPLESAVAALLLGFGVVSGASLALAAAGWYVPRTVGLLLTAGTVTTAGWLVKRRLGDGPSDSQAHVQSLTAGLRSLACELRSPWIALTAMVVSYAGLCALAPETEYDALWYHLELPRRWLGAGRPVDDVTEYVSLYPLGFDLVFGAALALDGAVAARLLHWVTLPLGAVVAESLARRLDARVPRGLAAAVFVTAPTVFWEATTAYVDLALAAQVGLGVLALVRYADMRERGWLWLAGLAFGLAAGTKHLGLASAVIASVCLLGAAAARRQWRVGVRAAAVVIIATLLLASPWYARAWRASGNPFFPELYDIFGASPPDRWDDAVERELDRFKARFGSERTLAGFATLPWDMTMHAADYGGTLGPLLLALVPGCVPLWRRSGLARGVIPGVVAYIALWASPLGSLQLRFLVPAWLVIAPLLAAGLAPLVHQHRWRIAAGGTLALLLVLNLPPFTALHEGDRIAWDGWLTHVVHEPPLGVVIGMQSENDYLRRRVRTYGAWRSLNAEAPADSLVLAFAGGDHFYASRRRLSSDAVTARVVTWHAAGGPAPILIENLRAKGITHVLVPRILPRGHEHLDVLQPDTLARHFEVAYEDAWVVVHRLRPPG